MLLNETVSRRRNDFSQNSYDLKFLKARRNRKSCSTIILPKMENLVYDRTSCYTWVRVPTYVVRNVIIYQNYYDVALHYQINPAPPPKANARSRPPQLPPISAPSTQNNRYRYYARSYVYESLWNERQKKQLNIRIAPHCTQVFHLRVPTYDTYFAVKL